ncbi:MAG: toprim domain-containing protein [Candidatus Micrarchaeota archaeon]
MKQAEKRIGKLLAELNSRVVLVEGKRDEQALASVGVATQVVKFSGKPGKIAETAAEAAAGRRVVLLYDFDDEGERKAAEMLELLQPIAAVDRQLRKRFKQLFGCRTVEQLPHAIERLRKDINERKNE